MRSGIVLRLLFVLLASAGLCAPITLPLHAQNAAAASNLTISGAVSKPLVLTLEDLKKMLAAGATRIGASASVKIIESV